MGTVRHFRKALLNNIFTREVCTTDRKQFSLLFCFTVFHMHAYVSNEARKDVKLLGSRVDRKSPSE